MAQTWSSCVELPIQRLFLSPCASLGLRIFGADATDAHAHSQVDANAIKCYLAADNACINWAEKVSGKKAKKGQVLPIIHSLQGHPTSGRNWMHLIDKILIEKMGFRTTTHDGCVYIRGKGKDLTMVLR